MKIVITGSLGHISRPLATTLIQQGHAVTIISSKADKQEDIEALGATAAIGPLEDAAFVTRAFTGADAVYAMVPPNLFAMPDPRDYYRLIGGNYAQAITQAGVKRVVYLSSMGAEQTEGTGIILGAHHVEQLLNQLPGIALTHLRPGYFYYNLYQFTDMIKGAGLMQANYGGADPVVLVSPVDIAAAAAEELTTVHAVKPVRYVASDERTCNEIAAVLGAAIGKPALQWKLCTDEQMQQQLESRGLPALLATSYVELFRIVHNGIFVKEYRQQAPIAMGAVKLETFAAEFAAAFKA
ncbi:NmrA family NAD(P)-binding protein [Chitinophaga vietnamensis]|uniref:NmrA family NAD(P)-binding protein n=1 Tax=Chitinophaga vietnamensis TaxID=2593957 RepID=UPI001177DD83|nr:NmrA family NAD(P)-binding protein [Chitinophaga vietnamensis]